MDGREGVREREWMRVGWERGSKGEGVAEGWMGERKSKCIL